MEKILLLIADASLLVAWAWFIIEMRNQRKEAKRERVKKDGKLGPQTVEALKDFTSGSKKRKSEAAELIETLTEARAALEVLQYTKNMTRDDLERNKKLYFKLTQAIVILERADNDR